MPKTLFTYPILFFELYLSFSQSPAHCEIITSNKIIKDLYNYVSKNQNEDYINNPYLDSYYKSSSILFDSSLPQLIPESQNSIYGSNSDNASDIESALSKKVTHLEINCGYPKNWDADADDDGIIYNIRLMSADGVVVPLSGSFKTTVYSIRDDGWYNYVKDKKVYDKSGLLKNSDRFNYFNLYSGYLIKLDWNDVAPYMVSDSDYGYIYVTFTDDENNSYSAKLESNYSCMLRSS